MRNINRVIENEIRKGSCPLRFDEKGFGSYEYFPIESEEKLKEVLSYLLRIREYGEYATKRTMGNVYMDLKFGKQEYHRTYTELERKRIYTNIMKSLKKWDVDFEDKVYLETAKCFFTLPMMEREKYQMNYEGEDAIGMVLSKKHILALFTHCLVARTEDSVKEHEDIGVSDLEKEILKLSNVKTGFFQALLMDDLKFEDGGIYGEMCTVYLLK